jgi:hypothetical protein
MNITVPVVNLVFAWLLVLAGFLTGMVMGMRFGDENWLGGYSSPRRRLYRLGHISFFGLAAINIMFYFTVRSIPNPGPFVSAASAALILGGLTMPICCWLMARDKRAQWSFGIPVLSLIAGATLTILDLAL